MVQLHVAKYACPVTPLYRKFYVYILTYDNVVGHATYIGSCKAAEGNNTIYYCVIFLCNDYTIMYTIRLHF